MGALSNTSTLLSTYSSTNKDGPNHFRTGGSNGNGRYVVGSIGKSCSKHLKRTAPRHPNVAIATQVINPSAIGGSLKNRRFVEHFGPSERDDEQGFLNHKRRSKCGKVCCYGLSIAVTVVMMTGLVLAVGYMQSEKQKISSRPVKLAQGQSLELEQVFVSSSTTQSPATLPVPATGPPPKISLEDNEDDMDEIGIGEYDDEEDMQNLDRNGIEDDASKLPNIEDNDSKSNFEDSAQRGEDFESDDFDRNSSNENTDIESYDSKNDEHDNSYSSAVKVLPPADFKFEGISFEFPIYRSKNNSQSSTKLMDYASAKEEETKELEKSINDVNSNFTSLNDSVEDNMVLSHPSTNEEDYANAHSNSNPHKNNNNQPDSLSSSHSHLDVDENEANNFHTDSKGSFTTTTDHSVSNEQSEYEDKNNNNFDFDILSSTAKLQTDIFDNNEDENDAESFETSASDQTKKGSENIENSKRPPPPRPKEQNNRYRPKNTDNRRGPKPSSYDNDDYESGIERPRSGPRKLILKTKTYKKMHLSKGMESGLENVRETVQPISEPQPPPVSHTLPILEYKADFSNIQIPKDMSIQPVKLDFKFPSKKNGENIPTEISDFKFTFTTPSPVTTDVNYNFKDFMNINKDSKNEFNFANFSPTPVSVSSPDFSIPQVQTFTPNPIGQFYAGSGGASTTQQQDNQFSKRTFYNYDLDPSTSGSLNSFANTNSNPFAHLLGPQPQSGSIGSATPTGATLNLFQPQQGQFSQSNYDVTSNNLGTSYNFPSGTVPVDLSASHISGASYGSSSGASYSVTDPNGAYSVTSLNSELPYPNIGLNSPTISNNLGNNQGNTFSFSNYGQSGNGVSGAYGSGNKGGVEILTTGQGQVPTYNTITQGIHLLSLLSGNTPQNQNPFLNNDQYSSASSYPTQQYEISTKPQLQIAGLTGYGGSSSDFLQGLESKWRTPVNAEQNTVPNGNGFQMYTPQQFENNYAHDINPRHNYRSLGNTDQVPSASFSKSIVLKLASPDFARSLKSTGPTQTGPEPESSKFRSLLTSVGKKSESVGKSEPKSLSVSILPNAVGSVANSLFEKFIKSSKPSDTDSLTPLDSLIPKSRKRDHPGQSSNNFVNLKADLDTAGSEINIVTTNRPNNRSTDSINGSRSKSLKLHGNNNMPKDPLKETKAAGGGGIRPGFYV